MIAIAKGNYISRIWFIHRPDGQGDLDVLAHLWRRLPDGPWTFEHRFRYYEDHRAHDSKDRKSFYRGTFDAPARESEILPKVELALEVTRRAMPSGFVLDVVVIETDEPSVVAKLLSFETLDARESDGDPHMTKRICNWCARTADAPESDHWLSVTLEIDGLSDGSISWLPSKSLDFCTRAECASQAARCEGFLAELPEEPAPSPPFPPGGIRIRLQITDTPGREWVDVTRSVSASNGAEVRAFARFFHATSHPKLRPALEAFEGGSAS